ncbi:hypothetical protein [Apibacter sp. HY039]|uniref:hypothetical protein n=1 Tax=Apibacter sp. HY039 TaxID=2501476 RepID=UPI000FEB6C6E|nr:hypothetical protein [Apibacter sp. HY039]
MIVGSMIRLEQKSTKYVIFNFKDNKLLIEGKQNESLLYSKIFNFNLYSLFPKKKLGYILRIQQEKGNFYFWITTKNKNMKWSKNDYQNILILNNSLEQKVQKKQLFIDYIIFGIALIPTIIISFVFLFVFVVLFSLITGNIEWFQYLEFLN